MRRKVIQDFANTLCPMLVGWRMGDDLELLAELPDGRLDVDVLTGQAQHSVGGQLALHVAAEMQAWFNERLNAAGIPASSICRATVSADISTSRIATNRKKIVSFDFTISSRVETQGATYCGRLKEIHSWHQRRPAEQ